MLSEALSVLIEKDSNDDITGAFFREQGVSVRETHPPVAGPLDIFVNQPAPYLTATAAAGLLATAVHAYAKYRQKRVVIKQLMRGTEIEITNHSATEISQMGLLDILEFRSRKGNDAPEA